MKKKLKKINSNMKNIERFREFQNFFSSSNLKIGIDNILLSEENLLEIPKEIWSDIINENP